MSLETNPPLSLVDAWPNAGRIPLDGFLERQRFAPVFTALLVFVLAFIAFNVVATVGLVAAAFPEIMEASGSDSDPEALMALVGENASALMIANTIGQIVGFGILTLFVTRLHSSTVFSFLRIRKVNWGGVGLAALGWFVGMPLLQWLQNVNARLPIPEWVRELEQSQMEVLERILTGSDMHIGFLLLTVAITPALCEEFLFRGYLQRQVERRWGIVTSIVVVGLLFGFYHLRLSQAAPLALLGMYLAFSVWATGSLWTGVLIHFLNNGFAVVASSYVASRPNLEIETVDTIGVPVYLAAISLILVAGVCRMLYLRRRAEVGSVGDTRLVPAPLSSPPEPTMA